MNLPFAAMLLFQVASGTVVLLFIVALVWLGARRRERQDFYLSEMVKKLAATSGTSAEDFLREYERTRSQRRREAMTICGVVGVLAAVGLMIFLHGLIGELPVYRVGLIPLLPSLGLVIYARFFASRD